MSKDPAAAKMYSPDNHIYIDNTMGHRCICHRRFKNQKKDNTNNEKEKEICAGISYRRSTTKKKSKIKKATEDIRKKSRCLVHQHIMRAGLLGAPSAAPNLLLQP